MAKGDQTAEKAGEKNKGGRPPDLRARLDVRLPQEDFAVLQRVEKRTSLTPDELVRMFVHIAIWESKEQVPGALSQALNEAREAANLGMPGGKN